MQKRAIIITVTVVLAVVLALGILRPWSSNTLKIGFNLPLSGRLAQIGASARNSAEMVLNNINNSGGMDIKGTVYLLEFIYADNGSNPDGAVSAAVDLIIHNNVLAVIGPQSSSQAIPAGEICDINSTPMISPWSTNPKTTAFRPYVFRGAFLDPFQGPVAAKFVTEEMKAQTAAVLYDKTNAYPKGLAKYFRNAFEEIHGADSVEAFESFTTGDTDFSKQLEIIIESGADILFLPQYHAEVAAIVKQARNAGWEKPIMGSDSWGSSELMALCGDSCKGLYFSTHYAATGAQGATLRFIEEFNTKYDYIPDDVAALTWDSVNLLLQSIQDAGEITGNLLEDRDAIKDQLALIQDFEGITGTMSFTPEGDPIKCAVVVKINDAGEFSFHKSVCP